MSKQPDDVIAGRYRIVRELGAGGMGTVYLAQHVHLGRLTAVKVLKPELSNLPDTEARFRREALLAAKLNHPAIAQIYDFDRTDTGEFLLAMEYVEGETVGRRLRRSGPLPLDHAAKALTSLAEGLDLAHALGILHRDIKPENVMLTPSGTGKLLDFGVARALRGMSGDTSPGVVMGTPAYMSPEQLVGEALDRPSDIYQLGLVAFQMVTGDLPHRSTTIEELRVKRLVSPPPAAHLLRSGVPASLSSVLARALEAEPAARWPSAAAFAAAFLDATDPDERDHVIVQQARSPLDNWTAHEQALRLAGREREIRTVREAWAAARAGRTTVLWVEGEEGSGKSSMIDVARREAVADGALKLVGRGYEAEFVQPYGPWLQVLRTALAAAEGELQGRNWRAIEALVDPDAQSPQREVLFREVAAMLRQLAEVRPVALVIEDLEWCDPATIALLEYVWSDVRNARVLIAASSVTGASRGQANVRPVRERLRRLDNVAWVTLGPLAYESVSGWLTRVLGRPVPDALSKYMYGHTEGNAFFIEQVVRSLLESGKLASQLEETAALRLADLAPPQAVTEVVQRRIEVMSEATRSVLQVAAVIGREFDVDLLVSLSELDEDVVLDALDEGTAAGILSPESRSSGDWYSFTHNKIADVLARALNPRRRRRLHGRIADEMERSGAHGVPMDGGILAWHLFRAGETARAHVAALSAAQQALAIGDCEDALAFAMMAAETADSPEKQGAASALRAEAERCLQERVPVPAAESVAQDPRTAIS